MATIEEVRVCGQCGSANIRDGFVLGSHQGTERWERDEIRAVQKASGVMGVVQRIHCLDCGTIGHLVYSYHPEG